MPIHPGGVQHFLLKIKNGGHAKRPPWYLVILETVMGDLSRPILGAINSEDAEASGDKIWTSQSDVTETKTSESADQLSNELESPTKPQFAWLPQSAFFGRRAHKAERQASVMSYVFAISTFSAIGVLMH